MSQRFPFWVNGLQYGTSTVRYGTCTCCSQQRETLPNVDCATWPVRLRSSRKDKKEGSALNLWPKAKLRTVFASIASAKLIDPVTTSLRSRGSLARAPRAAFSSQLRCRDEAAPRALIRVSRPSQAVDERPPPAAAEPRAHAEAAAEAAERIRFECSQLSAWPRCITPR